MSEERFVDMEFDGDLNTLKELLNLVPSGTVIVMPHTMFKKRGKKLHVFATMDSYAGAPTTLIIKEISALRKELRKIGYNIVDTRIEVNN